MRVRGWTVAIVGLAVLTGCKKKESEPTRIGSPVSLAPVRTLPPAKAPVLPTPPPASSGAVSEVAVLAVAPPAQVFAMLPGRKGTTANSEADCGSGEQAALQCVDLVVNRLPKAKSSPKVLVYAKKKTDYKFQGPCLETIDAVDCGSVLGASGAPSVRLSGRRPRLGFQGNFFTIRWRAMNFSSEDLDVKLVVSF